MKHKITCPNFECSDYHSTECEKYYACEGCPKHCSCDFCARASVLIDNVVIPCDMINLPIPCRFCEARNELTFSSEMSCHNCKNVVL